MARFKPYELKALFDHDLAGDLWEVSETIEKSIYIVNYEYLGGPYKRELYRRLFGTHRIKPKQNRSSMNTDFSDWAVRKTVKVYLAYQHAIHARRRQACPGSGKPCMRC